MYFLRLLIKSLIFKTLSKIWSHYIYLNYFKKIFFTVYKNEWKEHKFWQQKNQKSEFYKNKKVSEIDKIDVNKILVSKEEPYGTKNSLKYFIGYNDSDVRPLYIKHPQMTGSAKKLEFNLTMSFKISNKELIKSTIKYGKELKNYWK